MKKIIINYRSIRICFIFFERGKVTEYDTSTPNYIIQQLTTYKYF